MSREERKAEREARKAERRNQVAEVVGQMNAWQKDPKAWRWFVIPFCVLMAAIFLTKAGEDVVIPIMGMIAVTAWIFIPVYFGHKRKIAKQEAEARQTQQPLIDDVEFKRMKERLENLESILCNLDRE